HSPDLAQTGRESLSASTLRQTTRGKKSPKGNSPGSVRSAPETGDDLVENAAKPHRGDAHRKAGRVVGFDAKPAHRRRSVGRLEAGARDLAEETRQRLLLRHADDR